MPLEASRGVAASNIYFLRPIAGCTPVYPEKINPNLNPDLISLEDLLQYEHEGPFFEVKK